MVFGAVMFVFGITSIFVAEHWTSFIAFGVWVGVWVSFDQLVRIIETLTNLDGNDNEDVAEQKI